MEIEGGEQEILLAQEMVEVSYGKVDDVLVNGTSVVEDRIADIKLKTINNQAIDGTGNIQIDGVTDYNQLNNIPQINSVTLSGDKSGGDLGLQNYTDENLATTDKTVVGAINEVDSIAKGANQALSFSNYEAMITEFNSASVEKYKIGQNIYILTLDVPDLWVSSVEDTSVTYTYTTDAAFVSALNTNGYVQVGYYKLSALETQEVDLTDYVKTTDYASITNAGVVKIDTGNSIYGLRIGVNGIAFVNKATNVDIANKTSEYKPIVPSNFNYAMSTNFLTGSSAPTTSTVAPFVGALYLDTTNNATYQCTAITTVSDVTTYTWERIVKNTDYATNSNAGLVRGTGTSYGIDIASSTGMISVRPATNQQIDDRQYYNAITTQNFDYAVKAGITANPNQLTGTEKANAQSWLGFVTLTQVQYDALVTKDENTYYYIVEE